MKKSKILSKIVGAVSSMLLLSLSIAPIAASAATKTSGYTPLTSSVVLSGSATISTDSTGDYNILTDSKGKKYELNSSSVINAKSLCLYLKNTSPVLIDSIKANGCLNISAGSSELQVFPASATVAVDAKSFTMTGVAASSGLSIYGNSLVGLRSTGYVCVSGLSNLNVNGSLDGIHADCSVEAKNGASISTTGITGIGILARSQIYAYNNSEINAEANNGNIGIKSINCYVKACKNSTITSTALNEGIRSRLCVYSEYNSFVTGESISDTGSGVITEDYAKVYKNSCISGTGGQYGVLIAKSFCVDQASILNGYSDYGTGIRSDLKAACTNTVSNRSQLNAQGAEYGVYSNYCLTVNLGSTAKVESGNGTAVKLEKGNLIVDCKNTTMTATGAKAAIDIVKPICNGIYVKNYASLTANSTENDSTAIILRNTGDMYVCNKAVVNTQGGAGAINIFNGKLKVTCSTVNAISNSTGTPIKSKGIVKSRDSVVTEQRI